MEGFEGVGKEGDVDRRRHDDDGGDGVEKVTRIFFVDSPMSFTPRLQGSAPVAAGSLLSLLYFLYVTRYQVSHSTPPRP